jgi:nitroreductase
MATDTADVGSRPTQLTVEQVLTTTRNVRRRLDMTREVPRALIEDCAQVAMEAPIACNGFYPHFVVVDDPAKKAALAPLYKQAWDVYVPMPISVPNLHFDDPQHEAQQPRVTTSATYLAEHMANVPALVIPCITPRVDGFPMWIQACLWGSVLPQAWSFMLAVRARGLASAWTQIHIQFEQEYAEILGIDYPTVQQAALIAVAYPVGENFKPAYREPGARALFAVEAPGRCCQATRVGRTPNCIEKSRKGMSHVRDGEISHRNHVDSPPGRRSRG